MKFSETEVFLRIRDFSGDGLEWGAVCFRT